MDSSPIGLQGGLNTYAYARSNPTTGIDPLGLFTGPEHSRVTMDAFKSFDFPDSFVGETVMSNILTDFAEGSQQIPQAHWHGMCEPNESEATCYQKFHDFVMDNIRRCTTAGLGAAMHAVQDSAAYGLRYKTYHGPSSVGPGHILSDANPTRYAYKEALEKSKNVIRLWHEICECDR